LCGVTATLRKKGALQGRRVPPPRREVPCRRVWRHGRVGRRTGVARTGGVEVHWREKGGRGRPPITTLATAGPPAVQGPTSSAARPGVSPRVCVCFYHRAPGGTAAANVPTRHAPPGRAFPQTSATKTFAQVVWFRVLFQNNSTLSGVPPQSAKVALTGSLVHRPPPSMIARLVRHPRWFPTNLSRSVSVVKIFSHHRDRAGAARAVRDPSVHG
jgi:hypothetical protein